MYTNICWLFPLFKTLMNGLRHVISNEATARHGQIPTIKHAGRLLQRIWITINQTQHKRKKRWICSVVWIAIHNFVATRFSAGPGGRSTPTRNFDDRQYNRKEIIPPPPKKKSIDCTICFSPKSISRRAKSKVEIRSISSPDWSVGNKLPLTKWGHERPETTQLWNIYRIGEWSSSMQTRNTQLRDEKYWKHPHTYWI